MRKVKVVWLCNFSNIEIRSHLKFRNNLFERFLFRRKSFFVSDYGKWNTNAINEFKKYSDIELHIVAPHKCLNSQMQEFESNGIYYHFYRPEDDSFLKKIYSRITKKFCLHNQDAKNVVDLVEKINPDLVHCIGAENPWYSKACLLLPKNRILLTSLQTLLLDPDFYNNYPIDKLSYDFRCGVERDVILRSNYICTKVDKFKKIILENIKPNANFLSLTLALSEEINIVSNEKKFDFVYFSANINKAVDLAIEAFGLVANKRPDVTLDIVGGYSSDFKYKLDLRLKELGIENRVFFEGHQQEHSDVIEKIRYSKYALLPLKIDIVSGTIREAICNGLPVVTTITPGTPRFNENRESVLLSEIGNHQALADNMLKLIDDVNFAEQLKLNAVKTMDEMYGNSNAMQEWRNCYYKIIEENKNV